MLRQKREKNGTGICHVMQGKESKTCPYDSLSLRFPETKPNEYAKEYKKNEHSPLFTVLLLPEESTDI